MEEYRVIGKDSPNDQAYGKVTGRLKYCSDYQSVGMLHMKLKPSTVSHGLIRAIHTEKAAAVPGVRAVYTHENTPLTRYDRGRVESWEAVPNQERLFDRHIRYLGERVAAVVAETEEAAQTACDLIEVEYEQLPAVISTEEARRPDAVRLHESGNVYPIPTLERGDYDGLAAARCCQTKLHVGRMTHLNMETQSCRAVYDASEGKLTVWSGCQTVFGVRATVAQFLGMHFSKVRVIKAPMGGSFGVRQETLLEPLTAYAAKDLEADVKLVYTREEQIVNTMMKHSFDAKLESKVDESGKLAGMSIFCETDSGAYLTISEGYLEHISHKMNTVYPIPNFRFAGQTVCTNTPINGSFRSWGTSEMTLLMEDHLNKMCQRFGLDPIEFRLNNTYNPYERDKLQGISLGNARFKDCLTRGRERFGWDERKKWCQARNAGQDRYRCGVGMAMTSHTSSFYPRRVDIATANVRIQEDGSLIVTVGIHDHGCGTVLAMKKIAAEIFQIDLDRITLEEADTQVSRYDYGCYSSRTVYTLGTAVKLSCEHLLEKAEEIAGAIFGCNVCLIRYENGEFFKETEPEKRISMRQVAQHGIQVLGNDLNCAHTSLAKMNPAVPAAHFTQVEVDTYTGMVRIMHCLSVHDIGKAINPDLCRGQVGSGIQQGIGQALREEILIHPKTGEALTPNLKSYENMNAWDMPDYDVLFIEEPEESGPFNAKSIGEVVLPPVAPAVVAAVNDALGTELSHLPLTPAVILEALEANEA